MTRQEIETLFVRRNTAHRQRDAAALVKLYAEDVVVESPTAGGTVRGRKALEDVTRAWFTGLPDVVFTQAALLIDGDRAVWLGDVRGTDTGGFMGLAPTGKPFHLPMVMVSTVKDGAIVHEQRIYDFTGMLVQIGLLKAKPM